MSKHNRNPFSAESIKEMNSFKNTFLLNLFKWSLWAFCFLFLVGIVFLLETVFNYLTPLSNSVYHYFLDFNIVWQSIIVTLFIIMALALVATVVELSNL